ncbi:hypothetical protein M3Y99_00308500 [Aphelenchoides fujianensis]|nr:hypothetical protein M3Y99_00308500 [Aphelenchoides fujianensis]
MAASEARGLESVWCVYCREAPNRSRRRRQNETGASEQDLTTSSSNAEEAEAEEEPQPKKPRSSDLGSPAKPTESPKVPKDNGTPVEKPSKREIPTINLPSDDDDDIAIIETVQRTETTVVQDADGNSSVTTKTVTETIEEDDCQVIYEEQVLDEPMDLGSSDAAASSSLDQVAPISIPQIVEIKETTIASSTVTFGGDQPESNGERATSVVETRQTIEIIEPAARPEESTSTSASASDSFARANRATVTEVTAAGRTVQIIEYSRASERNGNFD